MQTPNTNEGILTERIMGRVRQKLPDIQTNEYNRTYEAVLEELTRYFQYNEVTVKEFIGITANFANEK